MCARLIFRGYNTLGVDGRGCPVDAILATVPWGAYLGAEALEKGVDVQVSSWRRMAPDTLNALAKIGGQYVNSQNIVMEAKDNGFTEGIALDIHGYVSEGSGENIFLVHKGEIYTPPLGNSILGGITRNCAATIAARPGLHGQRDGHPARDALHGRRNFLHRHRRRDHARALVDRMPVGSGTRGPVTKAIQDVFFGIIHGERPDNGAGSRRLN